MQKSLLKMLGVVVALALSATVSAVGMGGIDVASSLGQPLKVDIELVSVNKADKASLVARLASPDVYKGAGLEYPHGNKFKFQIESRANGESYIKVSSTQPINDPFVSLLVELTWSSGKLLREYTFLLDPPGYVPEQPKQAEVQSVAPAVQSVPTEPVVKPAPIAVEPGETQPAATIVEKPVQQAVQQPQPAKNVATGQINVKRGDTLNKIAAQNKPPEFSLERMLVALYRANADQFDGKNMNRIRTGKILRMPDQTELMAVSQSDAAKEIHAQVIDWNAYRQKLASSALASSQSQAAQQTVSGKIASTVADKAPVVKESAKEVLKLSKGEAPGDNAATGAAGKSASAQDKKNAAQEDAIAKAKALKEDQTRAGLLKKNLHDMQRLAELKTKAAALAPQPASSVASQVTSASQAVSSSAMTAASQVAAASAEEPALVAKPKPEVLVPEPSLTDQILGEPLYLAGGAAALLGLGGVGFMLSRRKKSSATKAGKPAEDTGSATGRMMAPIAPSPDTGDFTSAVATKAETTPQPDDVDPISEADLFLNFGRDAQAEEILKEALQNTPNNHQIHLKLLGIYANRKDVNSFSTIARQLKDSGDEDAWQQASAMGRKVEPGNPMYGGTGTIEDADSATMQTTVLNATPGFNLDETPGVQASAPDVDFDLGAPATGSVSSPENNFLDNVEKTMILSAEDMAAAQSGVMDFDVTSTHPSLSVPTATSPDIPSGRSSAPGAALPNFDDLIFDVTSTHPSLPAAQPEAQKPAEATQADDGGMVFTLDFPTDDLANKPVAHSVDIGLAGISLNLDDVGSPAEPAASPTKDEHWHEVATKLDLAKAYQEMGDATGAREILEEVMREGDAEQRAAAQSLLDQIG